MTKITKLMTHGEIASLFIENDISYVTIYGILKDGTYGNFGTVSLAKIDDETIPVPWGPMIDGAIKHICREKFADESPDNILWGLGFEREDVKKNFAIVELYRALIQSTNNETFSEFFSGRADYLAGRYSIVVLEDDDLQWSED